jgi:hypothetical protein
MIEEVLCRLNAQLGEHEGSLFANAFYVSNGILKHRGANKF